MEVVGAFDECKMATFSIYKERMKGDDLITRVE